MSKRTTHRSTGGKKLYAVRDKTGKFKDIQTYKKAHGSDVKRRAKAETAIRRIACKACNETHKPSDACKAVVLRVVQDFLKHPAMYNVEKVVAAVTHGLRSVASRTA